MDVNKLIETTLDCLNEAKKILTISESFEQIKTIDELISEANTTTDIKRFKHILVMGLKTQREGQKAWEKRSKE
jgi:hypothetical protein